jgi:molybdopterin synthase sulfur carrier subunit
VIRVLYFASLRERLGKGVDEIPPAAPETTVADIAAALRRRGAPWSETLNDDGSVMVAVNQEMATPQSLVRDGDEVAFFPPVTGG